ncbi:MAG: apolipoprotein N-acyltransferase [bacterium]|nr:apolipoprotein N-acyltransferase [bacterium]
MKLLPSLLLTLASALLFALAFPPIDAKPVAFAALAPFFIALQGQGRGRRVMLGWLWGVSAAYGLGVWFAPSMATYFLQPVWVGFLLFLAVATFMVAPYTVLFALLSRRLARLSGWGASLVIAAGWVACELLRGRLFTGTTFFIGNPWGLIGYSQVGTPFAQVASVFGIYGVGFAVVTINAALALAWQTRKRLAGDPGSWLVSGLGVGATLAAGIAGFAFERTAPPVSGGTPVALVQGDVSIGARWDRASYGKHLEHYVRLSSQSLAGEERPVLVFWPESAMTFFLEEEPAFRRSLASFLGPTDLELVAGGPRRTPTGYTNSVFRISSEGQIEGRYDKQYLVPLAESLPFANLEIMQRSFGEVRFFEPGKALPLLETRAGNAGVLVCNEAMLPEVAAERVRRGAEYLLNPTNDTWIQHPQYTALQFGVASMRAIEQRRDLVRVSTAGPSSVIDAWGRSAEATAPGEAAALQARVLRRKGLSAYARIGDSFGFLCGAVALLGFWKGR